MFDQSMSQLALLAGNVILGGLVGGGIASAFLAERWSDRREKRAVILSQLTDLVRTYHIYRRFVQRAKSEQSIDVLDQIHSAYYAEARLIGFDSNLSDESDLLISIASRLANLINNPPVSEAVAKKARNDIGRDFRLSTERILEYARHI